MHKSSQGTHDGVRPSGLTALSFMAEIESACQEKHYFVGELAALWNLSKQTIRRLFQDEPGVVRIGETRARRKRGYITLRIPESVAHRVHLRLCKSA